MRAPLDIGPRWALCDVFYVDHVRIPRTDTRGGRTISTAMSIVIFSVELGPGRPAYGIGSNFSSASGTTLSVRVIL